MKINLEASIDRLYKMKQEMKALAQDMDVIKTEAKELEALIVEVMDKLGIAKAGTTSASMSLSQELCPSVDADHWDEVRSWIIANGYTQLLPRSLNAAPFRELHEMGITIPYVGSFSKLKVSLTKVRRK